MRSRGLFASVFLLLAVAIPLVQLPLRSVAAADLPQLRAATGEVSVRRGKGELNPAPAVPSPLFRRDEVQTRNGTAQVELHSGVVLELGPDTLLAVIGGGPTVVDGFLAHGTLTIATENAGSHSSVHPVQIATSLGRVDLRAHEARIDAAPDRVLVQVITGSAEIATRQQRNTLGSGQELELSTGGAVSGPRPLSLAAAPNPPVVPKPLAVPKPPTPSPAPQPGDTVAVTSPEPTSTPIDNQGTMAPAASRPETPSPVVRTVASAQPAPLPAPASITPPVGLVPLLPVVPVVPVIPKDPFFGFTTLRLLRDKNLITQGEFDSAMRDLHESVGPRGQDSTTLVVGRWKTTLYGFVQADAMYHSTQKFNEFGSNFQVARPGTSAGDNSRVQASIRDSRIGVRVQVPEVSWLRASAVFEMDFVGPTGTVGSTITEGSFFTNPDMRIRHAYFKAETPIVDFLFGQTWHLFGWQPNYVPAVVQWPGIVGELFARTTQLRISKTIKTSPVTIEMAVAGMRPPQRDSSFPEFEAGFRIAFNKWTAVHTNYMTSTSTQPASIGVSGDLRRFTLPEFSATPKTTNTQLGMGIAADIFLPIIRATKEHKDNSLSILGEVVTGQGISDLYTGLTGGLASPALPGTPTPAAFAPDVDQGLAVYDITGQLQLPRWTTFVVGMEYYLPRVSGRVGLFANVSRSQLANSQLYANPSKVRDNEMFYNGGFFVDVIEALRIGVDYARFDDQYADGVHATNDAVQISGFLFF